MTIQRLNDRDAYVFFKQCETKEIQEEYEALRRKQDRKEQLTRKEKAFIKQMRERGRHIADARTALAFQRHFSEA